MRLPMFTRQGERRRKEGLRGDNNTSTEHSSIVPATRSLRIRTSLNTSLAEFLLSGSVNKEETKMPSAEETTYLIEVMPDTTQDFLSRDVDLLVSQIKENLRLSTLKAKSSISHKSRPSPYRIPSRSWADPSSCEVCGLRNGSGQDHRHIGHHHKRQSTREEDDPYELLQELLREGGLIKEAVKRLQANLDRLGNSEEEDEDEDEQTAIYRRKPYFYDSEEDPLPPVYEPVEL